MSYPDIGRHIYKLINVSTYIRIRHVHPPSNPPRSNEKEGVPLHFQLNSIALFFENLYIKPYEYDQI